MQFNADPIIEGTVAGVAGSFIFAMLLVVRNSVRSIWLRFSLRRKLRYSAAGWSVHGLTLEVRNKTGREFTVREVVLVTADEDFQFNPTGEVGNFEDEPKLTRTQLAAIRKGGEGPVYKRTAMRKWKIELRYGFVTVQPFTQHRFILPTSLFAGREIEPKCLRLIIEYLSWSGSVKLLTVHTTGWAATGLAGAVNAAKRSEITTGTTPANPTKPFGFVGSTLNPSSVKNS